MGNNCLHWGLGINSKGFRMKDYELHTKNAWNNFFREITHQEKHTENCLTCLCVGNLLSKALSVRSMKFISFASKLYRNCRKSNRAVLRMNHYYQSRFVLGLTTVNHARHSWWAANKSLQLLLFSSGNCNKMSWIKHINALIRDGLHFFWQSLTVCMCKHIATKFLY